jgi:hypothetical protein
VALERHLNSLLTLDLLNFHVSSYLVMSGSVAPTQMSTDFSAHQQSIEKLRFTIDCLGQLLTTQYRWLKRSWSSQIWRNEFHKSNNG